MDEYGMMYPNEHTLAESKVGRIEFWHDDNDHSLNILWLFTIFTYNMYLSIYIYICVVTVLFYPHIHDFIKACELSIWCLNMPEQSNIPKLQCFIDTIWNSPFSIRSNAFEYKYGLELGCQFGTPRFGSFLFAFQPSILGSIRFLR